VAHERGVWTAALAESGLLGVSQQSPLPVQIFDLWNLWNLQEAMIYLILMVSGFFNGIAINE
jgi:hypothetical protein